MKTIVTNTPSNHPTQSPTLRPLSDAELDQVCGGRGPHGGLRQGPQSPSGLQRRDQSCLTT